MGATGRSTLDLVNFEHVRDGGIVETPTVYAILIEVEPREWLTLSEERRSSVYVSFLTFLRGLQFPVQFLTMTTEFDGDQYVEQFVGPEAPGAPTGMAAPAQPSASGAPDESTDMAGAAPAPDDGGHTTDPHSDPVADSAILEYGRVAHAEWFAQTLRLATVRDRRFFVAVAVDKTETDGETRGRLRRLRDALPVGGHSHAVGDAGFYLDEVWARAQRVAAQLPRTRVETTILDSREAVLEVLYRIYRGRAPPIAFRQGLLVGATDDALTDADGDPLDLAGAFESADRAETPAEAAAVNRRPDAADESRDGSTAAASDPVEHSRLVRWYARHVGPVGRENAAPSPRSVVLGTALFVVSLGLAVTALGAFLSSVYFPSGDIAPLVVRELSFGLAAASLPTFLVSLVVVLAARPAARLLAVCGTGVTAAAIALFEAAYPGQWSSIPTEQTAVVVLVYAVGVFVLVVAVGVAIRSRRLLRSHHPDSAQPSQRLDSNSDRVGAPDDD